MWQILYDDIISVILVIIISVFQQNTIDSNWLVVDLPLLKNDGVRQLGWWHSIPNFSWKVIKIHGLKAPTRVYFNAQHIDAMVWSLTPVRSANHRGYTIDIHGTMLMSHFTKHFVSLISPSISPLIHVPFQSISIHFTHSFPAIKSLTMNSAEPQFRDQTIHGLRSARQSLPISHRAAWCAKWH